MRLALHYTLAEEKLPVTLVGCENLQQLRYNIDGNVNIVLLFILVLIELSKSNLLFIFKILSFPKFSIIPPSSVLKQGVSQEEATLINTIKEQYFSSTEHHWEGIGETTYWTKVMRGGCRV